MREFSFRFLVADEGIKVDFVQASQSEVIFKVYRTDTAAMSDESNTSETTYENKNVVEKINVETEEADNAVDYVRFKQMWNSGCKIDDIVAEFKISKATVYRWAKKIPGCIERDAKKTTSSINKELLIKLWNEGISAKEIANQLGTTEATVYVCANKLGCGKRKKEPSIDTERFKQMWNSGCKIKAITNEFKISHATVYRWVKKIPGCIDRSEEPAKGQKPIPDPIAQPKITSSKEDYPKTGEHLRDKEIDALCNMWRNGQQNVAYLARYFGVSKSTIYRQLRVNGCRR